jgi:hypothetical protein
MKKLRAAVAAFSSRYFLNLSLFVMVALGFALAYRETHRNASLFTMEYGFGPVIQGIVQNHSTCVIGRSHAWCSYATRMPLIPLLGAISYAVTPGLRSFLLAKNVVFWTLWIYSIYRLGERCHVANRWIILTVWLMILAPYSLTIGSRLDIEEGFLSILLVLLFVLLLTLRTLWDYVAVGLVIGAIYLTKSSMLLVCVVSMAWVCVVSWKAHRRALFVPLLFFAAAVYGWGAYIQHLTGVFAVGANASSWNGWNFYKGNNPWSSALYPRVSLDILDHSAYANGLLTSAPAANEWDLNRQQFALGQDFVHTHGVSVLKMDLTKAFVACCDIKEAPELIQGHDRRAIEISNLVSHLMLGIVLIMAIKNIVERKISKVEILFCLLLAAYLLPYAVGFLYMRHMVPTYWMACCVLAIQLNAREGHDKYAVELSFTKADCHS